jgi:two-component system, NtrC family, response regulator AtoC
MRRTKIMVVDDEHLIRWSLEQNLKKQGYEVCTAGTGEDALRLAREEQPELVLLDYHLPGINGLEVLQRLKEIDEDVLVIMVTAQGGLETAVNTMRHGAYDYINKPFNLDEMAIVIRKALETSDLRREVVQLRSEHKKQGPPKILGNSKHMKNVLEMMAKVAKSDASTVLVQGESGTGKELVAKWIHYESARADKPFVAINCAAVPSTLLESELFGHEKGAFTDAKTSKKGLFELADGGTVFLDEIGDMEVGMQAKLLRFLEDRTFRRIGGAKVIPVDVRIISATNKDLLKAIEEKVFRNDLYYRLQVIPIFLPSLRERKEDIIILVNHFMETFAKEFGKPIKGISSMAEKLLIEYNWPGNIRELKNVIERAIILGNDENLLLENLPLEIVAKASQMSVPMTTFKLPPEGIDIEEVERELIKQSLEITDWNQSKAAKKLNLGIDAFRYRMKKFGFLK